jgi:hypothetical protein
MPNQSPSLRSGLGLGGDHPMRDGPSMHGTDHPGKILRI